MKFRVKFNKKGYLRYISHLDLMRLFERTFNRIDLPVEYSNGFNPKPKISIASPLSLGIESEEEWMDIELLEKVDEGDFIINTNKILPEGIKILEAEHTDDNTPVAALINWCLYEFSFLLLEEKEEAMIESLLQEWLKREEILIERHRKKGRQKILVTESIVELMEDVSLKEVDSKRVVLLADLAIGESGTLRPKDFIEAFIDDNALKVDPDSIVFKRLAQRI